jgi:NADH-quinone oxidoreductase subunit N
VTGALTPPSLPFLPLGPSLVVLAVGMVGVLAEAFLDARLRRLVQPLLALGGYVAAFVLVVVQAQRPARVVDGSLAADGPALFAGGTILLLAITATFLVMERRAAGGAIVAHAAVLPGSRGSATLAASEELQTEVYPLMVFSVGGMLLFGASTTLLMMFLALEVLSLPLYLMTGLARRRRLLSQEAAVKYFLLGAFSSGFFLYGAALLYGYAGSLQLSAIASTAAAGNGSSTLRFAGLALVAVGLLFKLGAAPFHAWTPDVYQGAPTPVTAFMAAGTKVAAFLALLRFLDVGFAGLHADWQPLLIAVAVLTMLVGSFFAVTQNDVKRMLAYSSVAHAGFLLVGVAAGNTAGLKGSLFYLLAYGFTTIGSFTVLTLVRDPDGEAGNVARWAGLGRRAPVLAGSFALFLLALAGIPLTSGFMAKFAVFSAAISAHESGLVVVGLLTTVVTAFFYLRVVVLMFFTDPPEDAPAIAVPGLATRVALGIAVAMTLVLGIVPQVALHLAGSAASFLP